MEFLALTAVREGRADVTSVNHSGSCWHDHLFGALPWIIVCTLVVAYVIDLRSYRIYPFAPGQYLRSNRLYFL